MLNDLINYIKTLFQKLFFKKKYEDNVLIAQKDVKKVNRNESVIKKLKRQNKSKTL